MATGETYKRYGPKKKIIWQTTLPKGHLPDMSPPAAKGMTKMPDNKSLMASAAI